jgi:hypothetical protein
MVPSSTTCAKFFLTGSGNSAMAVESVNASELASINVGRLAVGKNTPNIASGNTGVFLAVNRS